MDDLHRAGPVSASQQSAVGSPVDMGISSNVNGKRRDAPAAAEDEEQQLKRIKQVFDAQTNAAAAVVAAAARGGAPVLALQAAALGGKVLPDAATMLNTLRPWDPMDMHPTWDPNAAHNRKVTEKVSFPTVTTTSPAPPGTTTDSSNAARLKPPTGGVPVSTATIVTPTPVPSSPAGQKGSTAGIPSNGTSGAGASTASGMPTLGSVTTVTGLGPAPAPQPVSTKPKISTEGLARTSSEQPMFGSKSPTAGQKGSDAGGSGAGAGGSSKGVGNGPSGGFGGRGASSNSQHIASPSGRSSRTDAPGQVSLDLASSGQDGVGKGSSGGGAGDGSGNGQVVQRTKGSSHGEEGHGKSGRSGRNSSAMQTPSSPPDMMTGKGGMGMGGGMPPGAAGFNAAAMANLAGLGPLPFGGPLMAPNNPLLAMMANRMKPPGSAEAALAAAAAGLGNPLMMAGMNPLLNPLGGQVPGLGGMPYLGAPGLGFNITLAGRPDLSALLMQQQLQHVAAAAVANAGQVVSPRHSGLQHPAPSQHQQHHHPHPQQQSHGGPPHGMKPGGMGPSSDDEMDMGGMQRYGQYKQQQGYVKHTLGGVQKRPPLGPPSSRVVHHVIHRGGGPSRAPGRPVISRGPSGPHGVNLHVGGGRRGGRPWRRGRRMSEDDEDEDEEMEEEEEEQEEQGESQEEMGTRGSGPRVRRPLTSGPGGGPPRRRSGPRPRRRGGDSDLEVDWVVAPLPDHLDPLVAYDKMVVRRPRTARKLRLTTTPRMRRILKDLGLTGWHRDEDDEDEDEEDEDEEAGSEGGSRREGDEENGAEASGGAAQGGPVRRRMRKPAPSDGTDNGEVVKKEEPAGIRTGPRVRTPVTWGRGGVPLPGRAPPERVGVKPTGTGVDAPDSKVLGPAAQEAPGPAYQHQNGVHGSGGMGGPPPRSSTPNLGAAASHAAGTSQAVTLTVEAPPPRAGTGRSAGAAGPGARASSPSPRAVQAAGGAVAGRASTPGPAPAAAAAPLPAPLPGKSRRKGGAPARAAD